MRLRTFYILNTVKQTDKFIHPNQHIIIKLNAIDLDDVFDGITQKGWKKRPQTWLPHQTSKIPINLGFYFSSRFFFSKKAKLHRVYSVLLDWSSVYLPAVHRFINQRGEKNECEWIGIWMVPIAYSINIIYRSAISHRRPSDSEPNAIYYIMIHNNSTFLIIITYYLFPFGRKVARFLCCGIRLDSLYRLVLLYNDEVK